MRLLIDLSGVSSLPHFTIDARFLKEVTQPQERTSASFTTHRAVGAILMSTGFAISLYTSEPRLPRPGEITMSNEIKNLYNRVKWGLVIRGLFGIALGIFILARPLDSVAALALVIAIWAVVDGIVNIVHSFELRAIVNHWWTMLLSGIVSVLFGVAAFYYYPGLSLTFAVLWTALWLLTAGILGSYVSMQERSIGLSWGWTLVWSIVCVVGGVFALMRPGLTLAGLISVIAAFGIVGGISLLVAAGRMQSVQTTFTRTAGSMARS
jgi:uncharacterized membrane protein HdeD (DUF308 family)